MKHSVSHHHRSYLNVLPFWLFVCIWVAFFSSGALYAQSPGPSGVRVGILTDCQYCDCKTTGLRHYNQSLIKLDSAIEVMNGFKPDMIFHLGDLIDHDVASYDSVLPRLGKFPVKVQLVPGNHDFMIGKEFKTDVFRKTGMNEQGYSVVSGDWQFIVLNGSDLSYQAYQTKEQKAERNEMFQDLIQRFRCNEMPWNGGVGRRQMAWLRHELAAADSARRKVVVLCHFPVYPRSCFNLYNDEQVVELLVGHPSVKAYFCGHFHEGRYSTYKGIHFVNFKGMVDTPVNSFATVVFTGDTIFINGFGREPDRTLKVR